MSLYAAIVFGCSNPRATHLLLALMSIGCGQELDDVGSPTMHSMQMDGGDANNQE